MHRIITCIKNDRYKLTYVMYRYAQTWLFIYENIYYKVSANIFTCDWRYAYFLSLFYLKILNNLSAIPFIDAQHNWFSEHQFTFHLKSNAAKSNGKKMARIEKKVSRTFQLFIQSSSTEIFYLTLKYVIKEYSWRWPHKQSKRSRNLSFSILAI